LGHFTVRVTITETLHEGTPPKVDRGVVEHLSLSLRAEDLLTALQKARTLVGVELSAIRPQVRPATESDIHAITYRD